MANAKSKGASGDVRPRTIEDLEAQAAAVTEAEREAMRRLAAFLRELAIELPAESRIPVRMAKAAKNLDVFTNATEPGHWGCGTVDQIVQEYGIDAVDDYIAQLERARSRV